MIMILSDTFPFVHFDCRLAICHSFSEHPMSAILGKTSAAELSICTVKLLEIQKEHFVVDEMRGWI